MSKENPPSFKMGGLDIYIDPTIPQGINGSSVEGLATLHRSSPLTPFSMAVHTMNQIEPNSVGHHTNGKHHVNGRYPLVSVEDYEKPERIKRRRIGWNIDVEAGSDSETSGDPTHYTDGVREKHVPTKEEKAARKTRLEERDRKHPEYALRPQDYAILYRADPEDGFKPSDGRVIILNLSQIEIEGADKAALANDPNRITKVTEEQNVLAPESFLKGSKRKFVTRQGRAYRMVTQLEYTSDSKDGYLHRLVKKVGASGTRGELTKMKDRHYAGSGKYKEGDIGTRQKFVPEPEQVKEGISNAQYSRLMMDIFNLTPDSIEEPTYTWGDDIWAEFIYAKQDQIGIELYEKEIPNFPMEAYEDMEPLEEGVK